MSAFIAVTQTNCLLAENFGRTVAELFARHMPSVDLIPVSGLSRDEQYEITGMLQHADFPGIKHQRRIIPRRPVKREKEYVSTDCGDAEVLTRYDDGFIKIRMGDGRIFRIEEAA